MGEKDSTDPTWQPKKRRPVVSESEEEKKPEPLKKKEPLKATRRDPVTGEIKIIGEEYQ